MKKKNYFYNYKLTNYNRKEKEKNNVNTIFLLIELGFKLVKIVARLNLSNNVKPLIKMKSQTCVIVNLDNAFSFCSLQGLGVFTEFAIKSHKERL